MKPTLPAIGSYVKAVQITGVGKEFLNKYIMCTGRLIQIDDEPREWGAYHIEFGDGYGMIAHEIEPSTRAEYDADWPEEDPETPAPVMPEPHCEVCRKPSILIICEECHSKGDEKTVGFKTASAVLTAGNDPAMQYLRKRLHGVEQSIAYQSDKICEAEKTISKTKLEETILLDLIAARMDQLKGQSK